MAEGLFGASSFGGNASETKNTSQARRTKLYPYDSTAMQLIEPYGESVINNLTKAKLWEAVSKGNHKAQYHSHLCAPTSDQWHIGTGISLTAAALVAAVKHFKSDNVKALIKDELYAKIEEEVTVMLPVFETLNLGKGSQDQRDTGTLRQAKSAKMSTPKPDVTEPQVIKAAQDFHAWLSKEQSPFRSFLFITAASNTFFTGHVAELVARVAVSEKPMRVEDFVTAMKARLHKPPESQPAGVASSATGLFES
ncbi:unnamed protein product [Symbiodinium sp. CCMP2592]|nr:unnamed protein product [Symbiodinium sp. CCMP2592]